MKTLLPATFFLLACPVLAQSAAPDDFPQDYQRLVASAVQRTFNDPRSVIDARISEPVWDASHPKHGGVWVVCMEANAGHLVLHQARRRSGGFKQLALAV